MISLLVPDFQRSVWSGGKASGCPPSPTGKEDLISTTQTGAVRCCSYDGGSCESTTIGCLTQTFSEAQQTCSEFEMRLCTEEELLSSICCSTGCQFDSEYVWYRKGKLFCSTYALIFYPPKSNSKSILILIKFLEF